MQRTARVDAGEAFDVLTLQGRRMYAHEDRLDPEFILHRPFQPQHYTGEAGRTDQLARQGVHVAGAALVVLRGIQQIQQARFQPGILATQDLDLALDQGHRGRAGGVAQFQGFQQLRMFSQEIRMLFQILNHLFCS